MAFQLKAKNKKLNHGFSKNKPNKFRSIFTKVKVVAKNVIYVKGWSKSLVRNETINFLSNKNRNNIEFSFSNFIVKTVKEPDPIVSKSKELRYKSFFKDNKNQTKDSDKFDDYCDHLVVIDKSISDDYVVGSYRLLLKPKNKRRISFYSESEFNIDKLFKNQNLSLMEAGRSCVHKDYRDGRIIKLLWRGLASYIFVNKVDLIFGCASFPSSNSQLFAKELSYLNSNHRPPKNFSCHPIARLRASYKKYKGNEYDDKEIFRSLPPLIKAYIRAGAWIGEGAVCDYAFNTTDVLVVLNSRNIIKKYSNLSI